MSARKLLTNEDKKAHLKKFMEACEHAEKKYKSSNLNDVMNQDYHMMRSRLHRLARALLGDPKYGQRVLDALWKGAFYSLICCMRSVSLNDQQKAWCDMQLSVLVGELSRLSIEFPDLRNSIYIYLGDLRRYAWLFFARDRDRILATLHYRNVVEMDGGGGLVYNQLGLLAQESEPVKALLYFFLAYSLSQRPFPGAFANILGLLARDSAILEDPVVAVIEHCLTTFSRLEFQELMNVGLEQMQTQLDADNTLSVSTSMNLLTLAISVLASKGKQTELRCLIEMVLKISDDAIKAVQERTPAKIAAVRRRHASENVRESSEGNAQEGTSEQDEASSVEDEDFGEDVVELDSDEDLNISSKIGVSLDQASKMDKKKKETQMLQVALLYFAITVAPQVYNERSVPAALKHQFESFCQDLCRLLNEANCMLSSSAHHPLWHLASSNSPLLLPDFLEEFATAEHTPVEYDGFFRFIPKSTREEKLMRNMAKMRLIHETKLEEARAFVPVYVVPEEDVLMQRPWILKGIVKKGTIIVVIAEDTLRRMDELKKSTQGAREAIRFIESQISNATGRLRVESSSSPRECASKLASQSQITDAVIAVILTMSKVDEKTVPRSAIMTLNAEKFYHCLP